MNQQPDGAAVRTWCLDVVCRITDLTQVDATADGSRLTGIEISIQSNEDQNKVLSKAE